MCWLGDDNFLYSLCCFHMHFYRNLWFAWMIYFLLGSNKLVIIQINGFKQIEDESHMFYVYKLSRTIMSESWVEFDGTFRDRVSLLSIDEHICQDYSSSKWNTLTITNNQRYIDFDFLQTKKLLSLLQSQAKVLTLFFLHWNINIFAY